MRIRKRFPPPSSLSSLPLSDPQLGRSLVVQPHNNIQAHLHGNLLLQEEVKTNLNHSDHHNQSPLQHPAGQETMIGTENPILASPPNSTQQQIFNQKEIEEGKEIKEERWKQEEEKKSSNDIRKEGTAVAGAEVDMQFPPQSSSSSSQAFDRWREGDRIVPLKKRKGSFERMDSREMLIKPKMKSKTNKKCLQENGHEMEDREKKVTDKEGTAGDADTKNPTTTTKKSKRGNVIMEGSRCSRVNGRGWRCCQQTLVGYSLCEHHLGKGRLRSMTSVRNRASMANNNISRAIDEKQPKSHEKQDHETITKASTSRNGVLAHEEDEIRKTLMSRKKRMKIGVVKARSISSLLGQTDNAGAAGANRNKK